MFREAWALAAQAIAPSSKPAVNTTTPMWYIVFVEHIQFTFT